MTFDSFSKNGEILPISEAKISLTNVEYTYGFGVYENIRVHQKKALFIEDHVDRLMHSAQAIELSHPFTKEQVMTWIKNLVSHLESDIYNVKILLVGARLEADCLLSILPLSPLFPEKKLYTQGATAITFPYERLIPHAKTLNMFGSYMAYRKARECGCYDALFLNRDNCITEGTRTNFFAIRGKVIYSPPLEDILEGVTRLHVLRVALENNFQLVEDEIALSDIHEFDGAFLTSTSSKIMPLKKINEIEYETVPVGLLDLMKYFDEFLLSVRQQ
jgi:branched-subunit amino acid aminotransferase/4-amino-4-deoxychorismate lyase